VDLGDGNQLKLVVEMVSVAAQRSDFVVGLMASAYGMLTASTKSQRGCVWWNFSVDFVSDLMGRFVVTDGAICGHRWLLHGNS
jgi:hypothetical protein